MNPNQKVLDESTKVAQDASKLIGGTFTQGVGFSPNTPISSTVLNSGSSPLNLPPPSPVSTNADALNASAGVRINQAKTEIDNLLAQQKADAKAQVAEGKSSVLQYIQQKTGILQDKVTAQQDPEFLKKQQNANDAYNELEKSKQAQLAEIDAVGKSNMTDAGRASSLRDITNKYALQNANLSVSFDVANRNYQSAQDNIEKIAQLKMEAVQPYIDYYSSFLSSNEANLSKAEQAIVQNKIDDYKTKQQEGADFAKQIGSLQLSAGSQGASQSIIQAIGKAKTFGEAIQAAGQYSGDILEKQLKQVQIDNIRSQIAERNITGNGADPYSIMAYAQQYAATGQIPTGLPKGSFGLVSQTAKEIPKQQGTIVNKITGIADSKSPATEQQDFTRLYNIVKNTQRLKQLDEERIGGLIAGITGKVFGSNDQAEYLATRKAIVDDIQRMQSGAALTESETAFYADYLPGRFSETLGLGQDSLNKITNFETIMNNRLRERLDTNNLSIYGYSTIKIGGEDYRVGDIISNGEQTGRVNPDGSITLIK